jgi:metal-sulfur cluster biosynthetic enzyme
MVQLESHREEGMSMDGATTLHAAVRRCFESIYDPCSVAAGTPVSLYDMGLLEGWELSGDGRLTVRLCVTFGACTMAPHFMRAAEESLGSLEGVREVTVVIDTSVLWSTERMTSRGRALLDSRPLRFTPRDAPRPRQWMGT